MQWLNWKTMARRYSLSTSTLRQLAKRGQWPTGVMVTEGRRIFNSEECDLAFAALLAVAKNRKPTKTQPGPEAA